MPPELIPSPHFRARGGAGRAGGRQPVYHSSSCWSLLSGLGEDQGLSSPPHSSTHTSRVQYMLVGAFRVSAFLAKGSGVLLGPPRWKGRQMRAEAQLPGVRARYEPKQVGQMERLAGQCPCSQLCLGPRAGRLEATRPSGLIAKTWWLHVFVGTQHRDPSAEGQTSPRPCCLL